MGPYLEKGGLLRGNYVKDYEMTSSWIIHVGPKSSDKCSYMRHAGKRHRKKRRTSCENRDKD